MIPVRIEANENIGSSHPDIGAMRIGLCRTLTVSLSAGMKTERISYESLTPTHN